MKTDRRDALALVSCLDRYVAVNTEALASIRIPTEAEERAIIVTTNKAFMHWPAIFNNDAGITSAILDRLLHQAETLVIEGSPYRMKDQIESPN